MEHMLGVAFELHNILVFEEIELLEADCARLWVLEYPQTSGSI